MTDEELKELVAALARTQAKGEEKTTRALQDLARTQAKGEEETTRALQDLARFQAKGEEETKKALQDLAQTHKRVTKQLGELGNRFGGFTEGMAMPSVREILYSKLGVDEVFGDARARRNGRSIQVDAVGVVNGDDQKAYLVEIKSRLREEGLQQILKHLRSFAEFFPTYRGKTFYGILVAVDVPEELEKRVLKQGIYLAKIHGDVFDLVLPEGFEPRGFPG